MGGNGQSKESAVIVAGLPEAGESDLGIVIGSVVGIRVAAHWIGEAVRGEVRAGRLDQAEALRLIDYHERFHPNHD